MTLQDIKRLLDQVLDPLKKQLSKIENRLGNIEDKVGNIENRLDDPDTGLNRINEKLDAHSVALIEIEGTLKGYADSYKTNKSNIERLDVRVSELEDHAEIIPPPELTIQR